MPASQAQIDEENHFVQIPFAADFIKEAPSIAADAEITEEQEAEIYRYYGLSGNVERNPGATGSVGTTPGTTISDLGRAGTAAMTSVGAGASNVADYAAREAEAGGARLRKLFRPDAATTSATATGTGYEQPGTGFIAPGDRGDEEFGSGTRHSGDANPDLITGEPGSHPIGTAIGGVSGAATGVAIGGAGAAATGAAFGAAAGPVGAVIGGVAGAVVGGLIGKGVEEHFDPTEEAAIGSRTTVPLRVTTRPCLTRSMNRPTAAVTRVSANITAPASVSMRSRATSDATTRGRCQVGL